MLIQDINYIKTVEENSVEGGFYVESYASSYGKDASGAKTKALGLEKTYKLDYDSGFYLGKHKAKGHKDVDKYSNFKFAYTSGESFGIGYSYSDSYSALGW
jgi:hypothetical protein